jgi:DeoR/GlpR family transcriptional regulator of sugar metabolism
MIQAASRAFLVADWTKYGRRTFLTFAPLSAFYAIVTNAEVGPDAIHRLREAGPDVWVDGEPARQTSQEGVSSSVDLG